MAGVGRFVARLILYALVLGASAQLAAILWSAQGLDDATAVQSAHDVGLAVLVGSAPVFALFGFGALRLPAVFLAAFLIGAALTAPFAFAAAGV